MTHLPIIWAQRAVAYGKPMMQVIIGLIFPMDFLKLGPSALWLLLHLIQTLYIVEWANMRQEVS